MADDPKRHPYGGKGKHCTECKGGPKEAVHQVDAMEEPIPRFDPLGHFGDKSRHRPGKA